MCLQWDCCGVWDHPNVLSSRDIAFFIRLFNLYCCCWSVPKTCTVSFRIHEVGFPLNLSHCWLTLMPQKMAVLYDHSCSWGNYKELFFVGSLAFNNVGLGDTVVNAKYNEDINESLCFEDKMSNLQEEVGFGLWVSEGGIKLNAHIMSPSNSELGGCVDSKRHGKKLRKLRAWIAKCSTPTAIFRLIWKHRII